MRQKKSEINSRKRNKMEMDFEKLERALEKRDTDWNEFTNLILKNLRDVENEMVRTEETCKTIEGTIHDVKELSKHAQAKSFVQVCKLGYVEALITHTGEYNVEMNSEYHCTLTAAQTVEFLEEKLTEEKSVLNTYITQKEQLERRLGFNLNEVDDMPNTNDMPSQIYSNRGVALKQGTFYEIIEEEPNEVYVKPTKRLSRINN